MRLSDIWKDVMNEMRKFNETEIAMGDRSVIYDDKERNRGVHPETDC